jgi:flagellar biosynthetic protein FliR
MEGTWLQELSRALQTGEGLAAFLPAARVAGVALTVPCFSSKLLPVRFRVALTLLLMVGTLGALPLASMATPAERAALPEGGLGAFRFHGDIVPSILGELLVGLCLGWTTFLVMGAVRAAATLLSEQIGFSLGGVMDPLAAESEPALRSFQAALATYIFLAADLHHVVLRNLADSFEFFPAGAVSAREAWSEVGAFLVSSGFHLFEAAVLLAVPVTVVLLFVSMVHGILSRVIPELEFLVFGFPVRVFVGIGVIALSLQWLSPMLQGLFSEALEEGRKLTWSLAG